MYLNRQMPLRLIVRWTSRATLVFAINAAIPALLHYFGGFTFLTIPWTLVALVGTAVAFLISFQNNAAYDRVWEARKIWGGIVNSTRTFGTYVRDMIDGDEEAVKTILYRHRAWLTAMRFAMRTPKSWEIPEVKDERWKKRFNKIRYNPERVEKLEDSLKPLLPEADYQHVLGAPNPAAALLALQSAQLEKLKNEEKIWGFSFLQLEVLIKELFDLQGRSERIKNFPYPRQYFTLGVHLTWAFILLLPYAMIPEFTKVGEELGEKLGADMSWFTLLAIPFVVCVSWIFHTMGRMGRAGENPFEGTIHDVPISAMARNLEIEISFLLNEPKEKRPQPFPMVGAVQM